MMKKRRQALRNDGKIRDEIDRISLLPDDILECILGRLSLKEANATSILSSRWRCVWTLLSKLDFDGTLHKKKSKSRSEYIRWVNDVIALHKKKNIHEFRIPFGLDKSDSKCIDKWVRFALAKKVEKLELDFFPPPSKDYYTFPFNDILGADSDSIEGFKFLRSISINYVNVSGEALELLLANSPLLEDLSVSCCTSLLILRVIGPFPSFKRLEIRHCHELHSVEIRDANLVYLKYVGNNVPFILENVPLLVNLHYKVDSIFGGDDYDDDGIEGDHAVPMFASILPQLETFTIDLDAVGDVSMMKTPLFAENVIMRKLKQLVVTVNPLDIDESLLPIFNVIPDSSCLERFTVKRTDDFDPSYVVREIKTSERSYSHLREVEFVGYRGVTSDLELIMYLLHNAGDTLEQIVVNTCYVDAHLAGVAYDSTRCVEDSLAKEDEATAYLVDHFVEFEEICIIKKQLKNIVPPNVQLKILGTRKTL